MIFEVTERRVRDVQKVSYQLSSKESLSDVRIAQLDWYGVKQTRSSGCKRSVAMATVCSWYNASLDISREHRTHSVVGHEGAVICHLPRKQL